MKKIYKREFERKDKRHLLLFGYEEHKELASTELEITPLPSPHMTPLLIHIHTDTSISYSPLPAAIT